MRHQRLQKLILTVAGLIATVVGCAILIDPIRFHAFQGIQVASDAGLLNEMRAAGVPILLVGVIALTAGLWNKLRRVATIASALLFLGYGLARLLGFALDGIPGLRLALVAGLELAVGLLCAFLIPRGEDISAG